MATTSGSIHSTPGRSSSEDGFQNDQPIWNSPEGRLQNSSPVLVDNIDNIINILSPISPITPSICSPNNQISPIYNNSDNSIMSPISTCSNSFSTNIPDSNSSACTDFYITPNRTKTTKNLKRKRTNDSVNIPDIYITEDIPTTVLNNHQFSIEIDTSLSKDNARASNRFSLRLSFSKKFSLNLYIRHNILNIFNNHNNFQLQNYIIAIERNKNPAAKSFYHAQMYLNFINTLKFNQILDFIKLKMIHFEIIHLHLSAVRYEKSIITYTSKTDINCLNNIIIDKLNFNYRLHNWANSNNTYDCTDSFVVQNRTNFTFKKNYFHQLQLLKKPMFSGFHFNHIIPISWPNQVVDHIKFFLSNQHLPIRLRRHIYLWGPPNTGKSTLIKSFFSKQDDSRMFCPRLGKFSLSDLNVDYHECIFYDEFNIKNYEIRDINYLTTGVSFSVDVKCKGKSNTILWTKPIIFVSNYPPPNIESFQSRIKVIIADESIPNLIKQYNYTQSIDRIYPIRIDFLIPPTDNIHLLIDTASYKKCVNSHTKEGCSNICRQLKSSTFSNYENIFQNYNYNRINSIPITIDNDIITISSSDDSS